VLGERLGRSLERGGAKPPHETLSNREFQVMCMLASGLTVAEIAKDLSLHTRTVGTFRGHIVRKLNLTSTQAIAHYAIRNGLANGLRSS
jgi:two-component system invasion response regulator UvrY